MPPPYIGLVARMQAFGMGRAVLCVAALTASACANPAPSSPPPEPALQVAHDSGPRVAEELIREFEEISGKTFVTFRKGSAALDPAARFTLERQSLWLNTYTDIGLRISAAGDGGRRDEPLALRRGAAVRDYLSGLGISADRIEVAAATPDDGSRRASTVLLGLQAHDR